MQINSIDVPEWLLPELQRLIESVPAQEIVKLARALPLLRKGYRNSVVAAPLLRKQLFKLLVNGTLQDNQKINKVLKIHSFNQKLLIVLSRVVIIELYSEILSYYGAERVLLATVLDERSQVREKALLYLSDYEQVRGLPLSTSAHSHLKKRLRPFLNLATKLDITTISSSSDTDAHKELADKKCADLQAANSQNKKLTRRNSQLEENLSKQDKQRQKDLEKIEKLCCRIRLLRDENMALVASHENLQVGFQQRVHEQVRKIYKRLQRDRKSTLKETMVSDKEIENIEQPDPATQAHTAQDHLGLYSCKSEAIEEKRMYLEHRVAAYEAAIVCVQQCLDSLKCTWQEGLSQLAANEQQLSVDKFQSERSGQFVILDRCNTNNQSCRTDNIISLLSTKSLESPDSYSSDVAAIACLEKAKKSRLQVYKEAANKIRNLNKCGSLENLKDKGNALLIIDGYNVLAKIGNDHESIQDAKRAFTKHWREYLIDMTSILLKMGLPNCESIIVFDGPLHQQQTFNSRLRVVYTDGGQNEPDQRADQHILQHLEYLRGDFNGSVREQQACYVITSDRGLQRDIGAFDAHTIEVEQFVELIGSYKPAAERRYD